MSRDRLVGAGLVLLSAAAFGVMPALARQAYEAGSEPVPVNAARFATAAAVLWLLHVVGAGRRAAGRRSRDRFRLRRRVVVAALALGGLGYAGQSLLFFTAVDRVDASLATLLLYAFPVLVVLVAAATGQGWPTRRVAAGLAASVVGLVLVVGVAAPAGTDALGVLSGLGSAVVYTAYITGLARLPGDLPPLRYAAWACTGAAATTALVTTATGAGWPSGAALAWTVAVAVVCTVVAVAAFAAGLQRVGATTTSVLSCTEVVVSVAVGVVLLGEEVTALRVLGAALVVLGAAVVALAPQASRTAPSQAAAATRAAASSISTLRAAAPTATRVDAQAPDGRRTRSAR